MRRYNHFVGLLVAASAIAVAGVAVGRSTAPDPWLHIRFAKKGSNFADFAHVDGKCDGKFDVDTAVVEGLKQESFYFLEKGAYGITLYTASSEKCVVKNKMFDAQNLIRDVVIKTDTKAAP